MMDGIDHEELSRCLFKETPDALFVFDPDDNRILDANPTAERLTGTRRKQLLGMKLTELLRADDGHTLEELIHAYQSTGVFHSREGYYLKSNKSTSLVVNLNVSRIHTSPKPLGLIVARDLSKRKRAEETLKRAIDQLEDRVEQRSAELQDANKRLEKDLSERNWLTHVYREAPVGLCCFDTQLRYLDINEWLAALNGLSVEEHLGRSVGELFPELAAGIESQLRHVIETGEPIVEGSVFEETPGQPSVKRYFHYNYDAVKSDDGTVVGVSCAVIEITERERAEELIRSKNSLLEGITQLQREFLVDDDPSQSFDRMLAFLLQTTRSEYGFIGEVLHQPGGEPFVKIHAITNIAWNDETRAFYEQNAPTGMEFHNLNTLFGAVLTTGESVIANDANSDPRRGGLPPGHPSLHTFLGLPFFHADELIGMVGLANRAVGYDERIVHALTPILATCAGLVGAYNLNRQRKQAEEALQKAHDELEIRVEQRTTELEKANRELRREIANRKKIEKRETQLGRIVEESLDEIFIFDAKTFRFVQVNRGARKNLGYAMKELLAMTPLDVNPQVTLEQFMEIAAPLLNGERKRVDFETVHRRKDGSLYNVNAYLQLADLDNKPVFVAFIHDITEHKRAEEARRENEQRYRNLFEQAPLSIWEEDFSAMGQWLDELRSAGVRNLRVYLREHPEAIQHAAGLIRIVDLNEGTLTMFEAESREALLTPPPNNAGEATGQSYTDSTFVDQLVAIWNGKSRFEAEFSATTLKGNKRECLLQWAVPRGGRGLDLSRLIVVISDVTELKRAEKELRLNQFAIDHSSDPIYWVKADGGIAYANQAACRSLGYGEEEILSMSVSDFDPDFQRDSWPEHWEHMKKSGTATFEAHHRTKQGCVFPVEITTNYLEYEGQEYIWAYARDITERKQAEEALRESEHQLSLITDNLPALIAYVDSEQCYQFVNRGYEELFGRPRTEIVGRHVREVVGEANYQVFRRRIEQALGGRRLASEIPFHSHDSPLKWLQVEYVPDFDSVHQVRGFFALIRDITDRKLAEQASHEKQAQLDNLLSNVDAIILEGDPFDFYYVGGQVERILGYRKELWFEDPDGPLGFWSKHLHPNDADKLEVCRNAIALGKDHAFEYRMIAADGREVWFYDTVTVETANAVPVKTRSVMIDITERKLAEEEKRKLQDHLRHTQKMDAVGQLAAGVAHEFNNILVGILGNAELLLAAPGDDLPVRFKRPLKDIERSGTRAAALTKQLLSFARKKNHNVSLFDVNQVIADSKGMLQRLVGAGITLKTVLASDPALVRTDEAEIEQAILSLVMNARDAMPNGGTLVIRTDSTRLKANEVAPDCKPGRYVRLSVIDDGCGMPPEVAERIFEPFFTTKPVGEGTGLGLSTIFADVTNSGGFVKVESRLGEGTVVRVHFPQAEGAIETTDAGAEHTSRPVGGNEIILVCDDDEIVLASVAALLQTLGYTVICANSPHEAIEVAAGHDGPISLLLTDVTMPGMDGIELGKEITRFHPDIRVVLTSGYAEDVLQGRTGENKHFGFLQKPVPYDMLARTIREFLD